MFQELETGDVYTVMSDNACLVDCVEQDVFAIRGTKFKVVSSPKARDQIVELNLVTGNAVLDVNSKEKQYGPNPTFEIPFKQFLRDFERVSSND